MAVAQPGADPAKDWTKIVSRQIPDFGQIPTDVTAPRASGSLIASPYTGGAQPGATRPGQAESGPRRPQLAPTARAPIYWNAPSRRQKAPHRHARSERSPLDTCYGGAQPVRRPPSRNRDLPGRHRNVPYPRAATPPALRSTHTPRNKTHSKGPSRFCRCPKSMRAAQSYGRSLT